MFFKENIPPFWGKSAEGVCPELEQFQVFVIPATTRKRGGKV